MNRAFLSARRSADLLMIALQAVDDHASLPVLGDLVQELDWFDDRVVPLIWATHPRDYRTPAERDHERVHKAGRATAMRDGFMAYRARPTKAWAKAIAAVLLFGDWRKGGRGAIWQRTPWPVVRARLLKQRDEWRARDRAYEEAYERDRGVDYTLPPPGTDFPAKYPRGHVEEDHAEEGTPK